MLGRLPSSAGSPDSGGPLVGLSDPELTARWLVARQTLALEEEDTIDADGDSYEPADVPHAVKLHGLPSQAGEAGERELPAPQLELLQWAGFNGRCNKIADTCYAWWAGGSLSVRTRSLHPVLSNLLFLITFLDAW